MSEHRGGARARRGRAALRLCIALFVPWAWMPPALAQSNGSSLTDASILSWLEAQPRTRAALPCTALLSAGDATVTIISAEPAADRPEVCRVHGVLLPELEFMLEMPEAWNGRLYAIGNGGYGGESVTGEHAQAERSRATGLGFATLFSNLGHDRLREPGADWARGRLDRKLDYGLRGLHASTLAARELLRRRFGAPPHRSYFDGCSTGGGQALKEAQRFPEDFDGLLGGAPVFDFVELQVYGWNNQMAVLEAPLTTDAVKRLSRRILSRFDAADGLADGIIQDPQAIHFEPRRDLAGAGFSDREIDAFSRVYAGTVVAGRTLAPGVPVGSEAWGRTYQGAGFEAAGEESGWATRLIPDSHGASQQRGNVEAWLKYLAFAEDRPDMDITRFDPARDLPRLAAMSRLLDAKDPDLSRFEARGGKLILYHGWADTGVNPLTTVHYFERITPRRESFARLYMVPGMFHCRGGLGVDRFDGMAALIAWVERGEAPGALVASRIEGGRTLRTQPLCPYPQVARYRGQGSGNEARNFLCAPPSH
ncbi:MAG: tannase/feruloyl esterase family alpha/beta hydrolase [Steroidobacteraceae bacterium]